MSISGLGMPDHSTSWKKRTQKKITDTNFAIHMAGAKMTNTNDHLSNIAGRNNANAEIFSRRDNYARGASFLCALPDNEPNASSNVQDTNTHSEIIVRPDGSRVLMITVDVGGTQAAMSLQISEPTDIQNNIAKQSNDSRETRADAAAITSDDISGSVSGT